MWRCPALQLHYHPLSPFYSPCLHSFVRHNPAPSVGFPLATFIEALAATTTIAAFFIGGFLAIRYRRKASVTISGEAHQIPGGYLVVARPSISSVGPFRLRLANERGAVVTVAPVLATANGGTTSGAEKDRPAFPRQVEDDGRLVDQFVGQGETLHSSSIFRWDTPQAGGQPLLGWRININVRAGGRFRRGVTWADRDFVPVPS